MKHRTCDIPECHKAGHWFQSFTLKAGAPKLWGIVCSNHDNLFGRKNLLNWMTNTQAIEVEKALREAE